MLISKVAEHGNGGPGEFGAAWGSFDAEEGRDGVKELLGTPLLDWEDFAAQAKEDGDLLLGRGEDVSVANKEGNNERVPLRALMACGGSSNDVGGA